MDAHRWSASDIHLGPKLGMHSNLVQTENPRTSERFSVQLVEELVVSITRKIKCYHITRKILSNPGN